MKTNCFCLECEKDFQEDNKDIPKGCCLVTICPECREKEIQEAKKDGYEYTDEGCVNLPEFKLNIQNQFPNRVCYC